jgi:hypothetical protein
MEDKDVTDGHICLDSDENRGAARDGDEACSAMHQERFSECMYVQETCRFGPSARSHEDSDLVDARHRTDGRDVHHRCDYERDCGCDHVHAVYATSASKQNERLGKRKHTSSAADCYATERDESSQLRGKGKEQGRTKVVGAQVGGGSFQDSVFSENLHNKEDMKLGETNRLSDCTAKSVGDGDVTREDRTCKAHKHTRKGGEFDENRMSERGACSAGQDGQDGQDGQA